MLRIHPPIDACLLDAPRKLLSNREIYVGEDRIAIDFVGRHVACRRHRACAVAAGAAVADATAVRRNEAVCSREIAAFGYAWE